MNPGLRYLAGTLALLAVLFGYGVLGWRAERPGPARPARSATPAPAQPPAPLTARGILERAAVLSLSTEQKARLEALDGEWRQEAARMEADLQAATAEFSSFMSQAQGSRRTSLQEIQRRGMEISELSARLRERRRVHVDAAAGVLADWQRGRLSQITSKVTSGGDR